MNYGLVSEKDNETTLTFMKSKKVSSSNIIAVSKLNALVSIITSRDVIYVISVDRFSSVSRFVAFTDMVLKAGVTLHCLEQPYLDVGNGKHWRPSIVEHLNTLMRLESDNAKRLLSAFKFTNEGKDYVARCVADITVGILAKTYSSDGIMHRGS